MDGPDAFFITPIALKPTSTRRPPRAYYKGHAIGDVRSHAIKVVAAVTIEHDLLFTLRQSSSVAHKMALEVVIFKFDIECLKGVDVELGAWAVPVRCADVLDIDDALTSSIT